jgi:hypothetical protein
MKDDASMNTMHLHIQEIHSRARQRDFLAEAQHRALLDEAESSRRHERMPALRQVRNAFGATLIRLGERMQAAPLPAGDCRPAGPFGWPQAPAR